MSLVTTVEEGALDEVLNSIRRVLRAERTRTEIEREAFEEFATRITKLQPSNNPSAGDVEHSEPQDAGGVVALSYNPRSGLCATDDLTTIRHAYEETVMSVPFYEAEYGDTYEGSIREEFGPDVATVLTQSDCFSPIAKQLLLAKVDQSRAERETLIETCERERESVDEAAAVLKSIDDELQSVESIPFDDHRFGALEAHWTRLSTLQDKCESVVNMRQATINHHRTEYSLPVDAPDICVYLYEELETAYPILYLCSDLARRVENSRQQVERAISTCS